MNDQSLSQPVSTTVAVLGAGIMGSPMAARLARAGFRTRAWAHHSAAADGPDAEGVMWTSSAAEAAAGADVVITMLPTGDVVRSVLGSGVLDALKPGAVIAQMGTIGASETHALGLEISAHRQDVILVDAPVAGSRGPAEAGTLVIMASGPASAAQIVDPVLGVLGTIIWVGEAGKGAQLKLLANSWMAFLIEGIAEIAALADHLEISHEALVGVIGHGPLASPAALAKLAKIDRGDYSAEFPFEWALKDVDLALASAGEQTLPALRAISEQWHTGMARGLAREDVSAARIALTPPDS